MALNAEHLRIAALIDARVRQLELAGCDDLSILAEMSSLMPDFKFLLDSAGQHGMNELCARFGAFFHFAKILETLAAAIQSGEIKVD